MEMSNYATRVIRFVIPDLIGNPENLKLDSRFRGNDKRELSLCVKNGMTLVEAVLALAILSIGIFILVEATAKCLAVVRLSRNYQTARAVLDRGEGEYPLRGTNKVEQNEVDEVDYDGYVFSRKLTPVEDEKKLFVVVTKVTWSETGHESGEELVSYVYCPNEE